MSHVRMRPTYHQSSVSTTRQPRTPRHSPSSTALATSRLNNHVSQREIKISSGNSDVETTDEENNRHTKESRENKRRSSATETPPQLVTTSDKKIKLQQPSSQRASTSSQSKKLEAAKVTLSVSALVELDNQNRRDDILKKQRTDSGKVVEGSSHIRENRK